MATTRSSSGSQRSPYRPRPPAAPAAADVSFAAGQRLTPTAVKPPSPMRDTAEIAVAVTVVMAVIIGTAGIALFTRDSMAVGKALSEQSSTQSSMVCKGGRMAHGDGSIPDYVFEDGVFVCTDWKTQQAIELETTKGYKHY